MSSQQLDTSGAVEAQVQCPACRGEGSFKSDEIIVGAGGPETDRPYYETCEECGGSGLDRTFLSWPDLNAFTKGYIEALVAGLIEAYRQESALKPGDKVRVHTDEVGTVTRIIAGTTKCVQVLFPDGTGGQFFPFECTVVPPAFSDLAPETLARIIAECRVELPSNDPVSHRAAGRLFWDERQSGKWPRFPPLTPTLRDDGKVYLAEVQS